MNFQALSLDFADTLFPHRPREMDMVLETLAGYLRRHVPPFAFDRMRDKFLEIRDRQFAENRATLRENDFGARMAEVIAFLSAAEAVETAAGADPAIIEGAIGAYADAFVAAMVMPPWLPDLLATLAARYRLAVVSNYPIAAPIVATLERHGLSRFIETVVVSSDIGFIKPHPAIFEAARAALNVSPEQIVHVGDDWDADIVGAARAGMAAIYTRQWRDVPDRHYGTGDVVPLAEIADLRDLPALLERLSPVGITGA